jgi:hypothetical protein
MTENWLDSLDTDIRSRAQHLITRMRALGASDAEEWVRSEVQENIPQLARFLVLRRLWRYIDNWRDESANYVPQFIAEAEHDPAGYFADAGLAMKRMMDAGVTAEDIGRVARMVAYEATFDVLNTIDEGYDWEAGDDLPGWVLVETHTTGEPTERYVQGLHESILSMDPSGREGKTG